MHGTTNLKNGTKMVVYILFWSSRSVQIIFYEDLIELNIYILIFTHFRNYSFIHSFISLSYYDRSKASSKASCPHSAI